MAGGMAQGGCDMTPDQFHAILYGAIALLWGCGLVVVVGGFPNK